MITARLTRNPKGPGLCPRCGKARFFSRGRLWPWSLMHCAPCDVCWFYGRFSLKRWKRDITGKPTR
jgi:hypothetical protein